MKTLPINVNNTDYTLEYNRYAVKKIEQMGFSTTNVGEKLVTNIELLFYGALIKNHSREVSSVTKANVILDALSAEYDTEPLLEQLIEMLLDVVPSMNSDKEGKKTLQIVEG